MGPPGPAEGTVSPAASQQRADAAALLGPGAGPGRGIAEEEGAEIAAAWLYTCGYPSGDQHDVALKINKRKREGLAGLPASGGEPGPVGSRDRQLTAGLICSQEGAPWVCVMASTVSPPVRPNHLQDSPPSPLQGKSISFWVSSGARRPLTVVF